MIKRTVTAFAAIALCFAVIISAGLPVHAQTTALSAVTSRLGGINRYETAALIADEGWQSTENIVVVSGEKYADALVAVPLAYALDAPILPVTGIAFDSAVFSRLVALAPVNAYIIGGTSAVSESIEAILASRCNVDRIAGQTRYETSALIAERLAGLKGTPASIFIASAENYPDALSAGPAAALTGSPILYSAANGILDDTVAQHISQSGCTSATVLGGTGSVSSAVESSLLRCGISSVSRLSGSDRYATALRVNEQYSTLFGSDSIVLATGESFPDALSGGVLAAKKGSRLLLLSNARTIDGLHECIAAINPSTMYVLGGTGSVSEYALTCLRTGTKMTAATTTTTKAPTTTTTTQNTAGAKTVTITSEKANVRSDAGSSYTLLGTVYSGSRHTYYGQKYASNGVLWYEIGYNGSRGYICAAYAQLDGDSGNNKYILSPDYKSKYYIVVYTGSQSTVVYGKDENGKYNQVIKSFTCSTGKNETPTITGVFSLKNKYRWRLMMGDVYCQYATRFASSYLFHSCIYSTTDPSTLSTNSYRNLGRKASHGCVRLCVRDAKWIYDNCPLGTQVRVVNASGPAGGSIPALKSGSKYAGWDPSDPSPKSPYNK